MTAAPSAGIVLLLLLTVPAASAGQAISITTAPPSRGSVASAAEKTDRAGVRTLIDHSLLLYGSGMGNPNVHDHDDLPILVAGGAAGRMRGGRHIRFAKPTPLANLHLTLLDKVGVRLDSFGDSRGQVEELF